MKKRKWVAGAMAAFPIWAMAQDPAGTGVLHNTDVVNLQKGGISAPVLKAKIQQSVAQFDCSTDSLLWLKKTGVPDEIIVAMMAKQPTGATAGPGHGRVENKWRGLPTGLYYKFAENYNEIEPTPMQKTKTGGLVGTLKKTLSSLIDFNIRGEVKGSAAALRMAEERPLCYFIFDTLEKGVTGADRNAPVSSEPQSPGDFFLVKLTVAASNRQIRFAKPTAINANIKGDALIRMDDNSKIPFGFRKLSNGIYEVRPRDPLEPGEYAFIYARVAAYVGNSYRVYDFGYSKTIGTTATKVTHP